MINAECLSNVNARKKKGVRRCAETLAIHARISPRMYDAVISVVESGLFVDATDYLRHLIRRDLTERNISFEPGTEKRQSAREEKGEIK